MNRQLACTLGLLIGCGGGGGEGSPDAAGVDAKPEVQEWAFTAGGDSTEAGYDIAVDQAGYSYVTGYYVGEPQFGNRRLKAFGRFDLFVSKIDPDGNLVWTNGSGGKDFDFGHGIAVDSDGFVYVTGHIYDDPMFGTTQLVSHGFGDLLVAKLDPDGNYVWAVRGGGGGHDLGRDIVVDSSGNIYVIGTFQSEATFGNDKLTTKGRDDVFVTKLNNDGSYVWTRQFGSADGDNEGYGIDVDAAGNVYISGSFGETMQFGDISRKAAGSRDLFAAKLDSDGDVTWVYTAGGEEKERGRGIKVAADGHSYVTGSIRGTATFATQSGDKVLTSAGSQDVITLKLSSDGQAVWVAQAGGAGEELGRALAIDDEGNSYVTGFFREKLTFGASEFQSKGDMDVFITKVSDSGDYEWATSAGDVLLQFGRSIDVHNGKVYSTGSYERSPSFGDTQLSSEGGEDLFVWKFPAP